MKSQFKWVGIILIGMMLFSMQAFLPDQVRAQADIHKAHHVATRRFFFCRANINRAARHQRRVRQFAFVFELNLF